MIHEEQVVRARSADAPRDNNDRERHIMEIPKDLVLELLGKFGGGKIRGL